MARKKKKITISPSDIGRLMAFIDISEKEKEVKKTKNGKVTIITIPSAYDRLKEWQVNDGSAEGLLKLFPYLANHLPLPEINV